MLVSSLSTAPITCSPMDQTKINPGHLYLHQQYKVEIIQLVEGPPPPRPLASMISSSIASSSSYSSSYSSSVPSDDDSESTCSSYCSSDDADDMQTSQEWSQTDERYSRLMNRVFAWREKFAKALPSSSSGA
jgi:hypothetical protein